MIFDYGMVLTGPPNRGSHEELVRLTGLPEERFEELYWDDRHAYDLGQITGLEFWRRFNARAGFNLSPTTLDELNDCDARMWTRYNPRMLAWQQQVKDRGLKTAILSNMGDHVHRNMEREFDWLNRFDVLVWSYQLKLAKPDPAIYRYALQKLAIRPGEALFLDDLPRNVEAALSLGMLALPFSTVEKLRADLIEDGFDAELPLPE